MALAAALGQQFRIHHPSATATDTLSFSDTGVENVAEPRSFSDSLSVSDSSAENVGLARTFTEAF